MADMEPFFHIVEAGLFPWGIGRELQALAHFQQASEWSLALQPAIYQLNLTLERKIMTFHVLGTQAKPLLMLSMSWRSMVHVMKANESFLKHKMFN